MNHADGFAGQALYLHFIRIGLMAVLASCVLFAVTRLAAQLLGHGLTPWWANALGAWVMAATWAWFDRDPEARADVTVHIVGATALGALLVPVAYGMYSTLWWVSLIAFAMALLAKPAQARLWTGLCLLGVGVASLWGERIQVEGGAGEGTVEVALARVVFLAVLLGMALTFRSVTNRHAEAVAEARAQAERSSKAKSAFLAHMSHELRTPLNGVISMLDLALRGEADPEIRDHLKTASTSAQLLLRLIQDVLDTTRLEDAYLELNEGSFELHRGVGDILLTLRERAASRGLTLVGTADPDMREWRHGDGLRVAQIVLNLTANAVKFTESGRVDVHISDVGRDRVRIVVSDTGVGIAPADLDAIFEPFVQVGTRGSRHAGTGLGLSITRALVTNMQGTIHVKSKLGEGSSFIVELRLPPVSGRVELGPDDLLARRSFGTTHPVPVSSLGIRVLAVDDDPTNRLVMERLLAVLGCEVTTAVDGKDALDRLDEREFDLALVDLEMPVLDGLGLLREIGNRGLTLAAIAVSAHADGTTREKALSAGATEYLAKPFNLDQLADVLQRVGFDAVRPTTER